MVFVPVTCEFFHSTWLQARDFLTNRICAVFPGSPRLCEGSTKIRWSRVLETRIIMHDTLHGMPALLYGEFLCSGYSAIAPHREYKGRSRPRRLLHIHALIVILQLTVALGQAYYKLPFIMFILKFAPWFLLLSFRVDNIFQNTLAGLFQLLWDS